MILTNIKKDDEMALNINNDIYRLVKGLNEIEDFKKLLICSDYDLKEKKDLSIDLIDKVIVRTPLIPNIDKSVCAITINKAISRNNHYYLQISIDVLTPLNQWLVKDGIRPLLLCNCIDNFIKNFNQTNGVRYRLLDISNMSLGDELKGFRLCYHTIIDN
jgi:peroxiredoxin